MMLLLDTSSSLCTAIFIDGESRSTYQWQADRQLAKGLLGWLKDRLADENKQWHDLSGIGVYQGPGSFTGLRIGLSVANTLADGLSIPIVGATGDDWQAQVTRRLGGGDNDQIVLPHYGSDANITTARK